jgi:hypothetical protein
MGPEEVWRVMRSLKDLHGYTIQAADGDIGKVDDFTFDDQTWTVRYLVADTGNWLVGRRVLLSPVSLGHPDWEKRAFPVGLTKEQVENSPTIAADRPVSRQVEAQLHAYYGWRPYWSSTAAAAVAQARVESAEEIAEKSDPHLRSVREVSDYHIQANDGEIGHVDDFIAAEEDWVIRYMVVDTRNWLPGKRVLVAPTWVEKVSWRERKVHVNLSRNMIKDSPEFDPSAPVNREYELRLYDYYGRPKYWTRVDM